MHPFQRLLSELSRCNIFSQSYIQSEVNPSILSGGWVDQCALQFEIVAVHNMHMNAKDIHIGWNMFLYFYGL